MPVRTDVEPIDRAAEDDDARVPAEFVDAFSASMPARYRVLFDPRALRKHAAVAYRRGDRLAHAELWRALPDGSGALCVVAEDRPGLLALIAATLVSHRLDVITALVFARPREDGADEAVDLFWVRRAASHDTSAIEPSEATSIGLVLSALLSGSASVDEIAPRPSSLPPPQDPAAIVRFEETDEDGLAVLVVEARDRPGMLLAISRALFAARLSIVRSLVRTAEGHVHNRFELAELDGSRVKHERRAQIRSAVIDALTRHAARPPRES